jgi:predicted HAD superfamily phosphohydrolase YqeG
VSRRAYLKASDLVEVVAALVERAPASVVVDIEPLVADWVSGQAELDAGVTSVLEAFSRLPGSPVVVFATNSRRRADRPLESSVRYLTLAGKPLRTAPFSSLPRPAMVVGDQFATDGLLALRLGFEFVWVDTRDRDVPLGSRLMGVLGWPVRRLFFESPRTNDQSI